MLRPRIIACLLLKDQGLVKGQAFKNHQYVGDPINAVQIFNSKEADEILFLDISATAENRTPSKETIQRIADQCLLPFGVGGGINTVESARAVLAAGAEKICLNTAAMQNPNLVSSCAEVFGSQSVVVSIDVKRNPKKQTEYELTTHCGTKSFPGHPIEMAIQMEKMGAGEILLNSIDHDGLQCGYDTSLIYEMSRSVRIPVIASGGAGKYGDFKAALQSGASAVAAGSLFVFHGRRKAVLISYPNPEEHEEIVREFIKK